MHVVAVLAAEGRTTSDSVDGVTFFVHAFPGLLIGLLANLAWSAWAVVDVARRRRYVEVAWLGVAVAVWGTTVLGGRLGWY